MPSFVSFCRGARTHRAPPCREAFHCEVFARPQILKRRAELTKQDMLAMALQMYQRQLKQAAVAEMQRTESADGSVIEKI